MHPKHPLEALLKLVADGHDALSELGEPEGDLHLMASSVWFMLGIQLSKAKPPLEQLKLLEDET